MRSKVQKEINEVSKKLGNLTDKQLEQYVSEAHKKQNKERITKGGIVQGYKLYKEKRGIFGMSEQKRKKVKINGGKVAGKMAVENGTVFIAAKASIKSPNNINKKTFKCPHCKKEGAYRIMMRWHGDNCKLKKVKK